MGATTSNLKELRNKSEVVESASNAICELLECPVCLNSMHPPIHQCSNGHTICSGCKPKVQNKCPTCRGELGNIRCLALEKVATSLELQCLVKLKSPYKCPYVFSSKSECTTSGDILHLVAHLKDDHKVFFHIGCTFSYHFVHNNPQNVDPTWNCRVYSCFGQYFCLQIEGFQFWKNQVYIIYLRFMGDDNDAKKYNYSLEVGDDGRKLTWQGMPRSIRDSRRKVRDNFDGLVIRRHPALSYFGEYTKQLELTVTCRIWKK